jgi:hypothetical protein
MDRPLTPQDVEIKLHNLAEELEDVYLELKEAEYAFYTSKTALEVGKARSLLLSLGDKMTVAERDAHVTVECESFIHENNVALAMVNAGRKNFDRIKTQIEIARSQSSIIRTALEM